jgi:arginine decarboxylase-like protein
MGNIGTHAAGKRRPLTAAAAPAGTAAVSLIAGAAITDAGDTVTDVLNYVQFNRRDLVIQVRRACEQAVKSGQMTIEESTKLLSTYQRGLEGYTYLE